MHQCIEVHGFLSSMREQLLIHLLYLQRQMETNYTSFPPQTYNELPTITFFFLVTHSDEMNEKQLSIYNI